MRYILNTDIPKKLKSYSKGHLYSFIDYLVSTGKVKRKTNTGVRLSSIVLDVFIYNVHLTLKNNKGSVVLTLDKNSYNKGYIVNGKESKTKVSKQYTEWVISYFEHINCGWLEKGGAEFEGVIIGNKRKAKLVSLKVSLFHISDKLKDEINELSVGFIPDKNVMILRDENKKDKAFKLPTQYKNMKDILIQANEWFKDVSVYDPKKDLYYILQLRKIFNENFNKGGRMYDFAIQGLSKAERYRLRIDGKETCVHDFKAFETSLLYSLEGIEMEGDPYQTYIKHYDPDLLREIGKMFMTRIYYAESMSQLCASVSEDIFDNFDLEFLQEIGDIPEKRIPVVDILRSLMEKHKCIEHHFFRQSGVDPSNLGSRVMDHIFESMVQNYRVAMIPVFDEVICDKDYEEEVRQAMVNGYNFVVGTDMNCVITKEK